MTKDEVKDLIEKLETNFVMTSLSLGFIHNPEIKKHADSWMDPGSTATFGSRKDTSSEKKYDVHKIYAKFFGDQANNIDYMRIPMMAMLSLIHDTLRENGFEKQTPEFEFFRHIRNAASHGNRLTFKNGEPRRPASYNGFTIDASMNGMTDVIHNYIHFGDILNLINYIKDNL
jgi:hypothetical protein